MCKKEKNPPKEEKKKRIERERKQSLFRKL